MCGKIDVRIVPSQEKKPETNGGSEAENCIDDGTRNTDTLKSWLSLI